MAIDPEQVPRYAHGSRVPGWDDAADLTKNPAVVPDPATTHVPDDIQAAVEDFMARYPDKRSAAIPSMRFAQSKYGWLTPTAIEQVACAMRVTPGYLISVASFYDMFETTPAGEHTIYVCTNISCSLLGADDLYAALQDAAGEDERFNVRAFECLGACDIAPMASVNGTYVGPLTLEDARTLISQLADGADPLPDKQLQKRAIAVTHWARDESGGRQTAGGKSAKGKTKSTSDERAETQET